MTSIFPLTILTHFKRWADCECWCLCNENKAPATRHGGFYYIPEKYHYAPLTLCKWRTEPQDHISTMGNIKTAFETLNATRNEHGVMYNPGFGLFCGWSNTIICYDFDHCIVNGKITQAVRDFLEKMDTFVEVSTSGTGLHLFVFCSGEDTGGEYDFKPDFSAGKCYPARHFIKTTGVPFEDYDRPLKEISEDTFHEIKAEYGNTIAKAEGTMQPQCNAGAFSRSTVYSGDLIDWNKVLVEAGIRYEVMMNYTDISRKHGDVVRVSKFAAKIMCPNHNQHTDYASRSHLFGPDCGILVQYHDGSSSLSCNHNSCSPTRRPNLLQKLWTQIKDGRLAEAKRILLRFGKVVPR